MSQQPESGLIDQGGIVLFIQAGPIDKAEYGDYG